MQVEDNVFHTFHICGEYYCHFSLTLMFLVSVNIKVLNMNCIFSPYVYKYQKFIDRLSILGKTCRRQATKPKLIKPFSYKIARVINQFHIRIRMSCPQESIVLLKGEQCRCFMLSLYHLVC